MEVSRDDLLEALRFYADPESYRSPSRGWNAQYDPEPSPIDKDKGHIARVTLGEDAR